MDRRDFVTRVAVGGGLLAVAPAELARTVAAPALGVTALQRGWRFVRGDPGFAATAFDFDDAAWTSVNLPHTARLEALVTGARGSATWQWQGLCWYRRVLEVDESAAGARIWLRFGAAMNVAEVYLDGRRLGAHLGGYTPFAFDITNFITPGRPAMLAVRLDNRDNAVTGPKPLHDLDFNMYGGLYRMVELVVKDALQITDAILADRPASGGILVRTLEASPASATVSVQVHVRNASDHDRRFTLLHTLSGPDGRVAATVTTTPTQLAPGADADITATLQVRSPALWHPRSPSLYTLETALIEAERVLETERTRVGIRRFAVSAEGLRINGERMFLRGTNRHQDYPFLGYAISDDAQFRDAKLIKEAGFDYIRLSHYLHAPAFMDACDELGLVVMNCIPGWQYFNRRDGAFTELQYENIRRMMRRDRNHACVLLWETSLNETSMPPEFVERSHAIGHEELPGDQTFTCGWSGGYDVFIQARQHGGCTQEKDRPCVVSEYGDWEYYAQNAGLNQAAWANLAPDEQNSRQLRWHGERRLLQQCTNFQEAANDNRKTIAFGDGLWVMFDYNRGYAPDIESSGCADLFRLPKFSYHFFRSQRDPRERYAHAATGPMVFIASHWTSASPLPLRVFSNTDEVELRVNGRLLAKQRPDADRLSTNLAHAPFTFAVAQFEPGTLEAIGYLDGQVVARHVVRTPEGASQLRLSLADQGRPFALHTKDEVFAHASLHDRNGTLVVDAWENVAFGTTGGVQVVGANPYSTEAGIASILLTSEVRRPRGALYALALVPEGDAVRVLTAAIGAGGAPATGVVRIATNGRPPTLTSPEYTTPLARADGLVASLFIGERAVATLALATPKFRVAGSTAPTPPQR